MRDSSIEQVLADDAMLVRILHGAFRGRIALAVKTPRGFKCCFATGTICESERDSVETICTIGYLTKVLGAGDFGGCFGGFCVMSICNQKLVYERLRANRSEIVEAHKSMGDRASVIVGGGTAIATCFGIGDKLAQTNLTCLILVGVATLIAMTAATMVWVPTSTLLPGVSDEDDLWQSFIDVDEETAAANLIRDEANALDAEVAANARRAVAFRVMTIAVWFQLIFVFIAVWLGK
jgi:hypothetical protein